jgi:hypothetical protein
MTSEQSRAGQSRADRFARELADLKISDPAAGHPRLWQRLGAAGMALGIVLAVTAYLVSHRTTSSLTQGDAITIGLGGVTLSVVGGVIFLRYSLTGFLRFWMARQSFELNVLAERAFSGGRGVLANSDGLLDKDASRGLSRTDS